MKASAQLRVYLFGRFRIEQAEETIRLPTRQSSLLLAYLILRPGPQSREKLAALFWGDVPDSSARASLRNALSTLRRQLGRDLLLTDRETAQINPDYPLWVDALLFQTQANDFLEEPSPDPATVDLDLYGGDLLADFYADWVLVERDALRTLYLETLLALTQQMRSQGDYERAIGFAEQILASDRAHERAHQHLMFCHAALGNRTAALKQYEACRIALRDELAVEPSQETKKLYRWLQQAPPERIPVEAAITNLPIPLTAFVGRRREVADIRQLLLSVRLLTLTGAGGSGKSRLAIQVATDLLDRYEDGVWWIEVAELSDAQLVPRMVAKTLGAPEVPHRPVGETLVRFLHSKELLLILDNCEHLLGACARLVEQLLSKCAQLTVMTTSREMLGITGEQVWPVPTLSIPKPAQRLSVDELLRYEAVRLFVQRATAVRPDFTLTEANALPVANICWRLEGLPLAVELAAARIKVLSAEQIASRLDDSFSLLTDGSRTALPRHQTLQATIDWSYKLLSEKERTLFRRLAVFAGGWTLPAAETICSGAGIAQDEVFDLLSRLADKSLVEAQVHNEQTRFRILQPIQQYNRELLLESGEFDAVHRRHLDYFTHLVEEAAPHLGYFLADTEMAIWLQRIEAEYDNVRAAIHWVLDRRNQSRASLEAGLRLAGTLHWLWAARGHFAEGRSWLNQLLEADPEATVTTEAQAMLTAGYLACWQGDFVSGRAPLDRALTLYRQLEDGSGIAFALHGLGFVALGQGNASLSRSRFEESLQIAREEDDQWLLSFALHFLAIVLTYQGVYDSAAAYFEEGNLLLEQLGGHKQGLAFSFFHLARIARLLGDYPTARSHLATSMELFQQAGDRRGMGYVLAGFAILSAAQERMERAAQLAGAVASLQTVLGPFLEAPLQHEYDQALATVQTTLDDAAFAAASAKGQAMTITQAITFALESGDR
ncbi:MAG: BTAD domain-containing putative transcriptional regulator [Candidatus Promineifilaceae bacterium]|nr:BTAD domain-containing putative transcriptional regulator [Candidatus Promineifilaceae bacterium]